MIFNDVFIGFEWIPYDDDTKWEITVHLRQCRRILGSFYGLFYFYFYQN